MIKNYIFDFGQVLVEFNPRKLTSVYVHNEDDIETISEIIFDRIYWDKLDEGSITDEQVIHSACSRLPEKYHKIACEVYDNWIKNLTPIDGVIDIIRELKESNCRLYLLSNISKKFAETYKSVPKINDILSLFDGLVFSAEIGLTKPHKQIFEYLLNEFDLSPYESVFIDDNINNIVGAESVGINGYCFDGDIDKLKSFIFTD